MYVHYKRRARAFARWARRIFSKFGPMANSRPADPPLRAITRAKAQKLRYFPGNWPQVVNSLFGGCDQAMLVRKEYNMR
jgi:hypothetical protein